LYQNNNDPPKVFENGIKKAIQKFKKRDLYQRKICIYKNTNSSGTEMGVEMKVHISIQIIEPQSTTESLVNN